MMIGYAIFMHESQIQARPQLSNKDFILNSVPNTATNLVILDEYKGWFYFTLDNQKYLAKLNKSAGMVGDINSISFTKCD